MVSKIEFLLKPEIVMRYVCVVHLKNTSPRIQMCYSEVLIFQDGSENEAEIENEEMNEGEEDVDDEPLLKVSIPFYPK